MPPPMSLPIWKPDARRAAATHMAAFTQRATREPGPDLPRGGSLRTGDYDLLWRWSIRHPARFWEMVWDFCDVRASRTADQVLRDAPRMPGARWFEGAELNFAENLLKQGRLRPSADAPALIALDESGRRRELSLAQLRERVRAVAAALKADGVGPGDRVAGFLPNTLEALIAMLATASLGAIWSSCSPDFGLQGVLERFGQIAPKVLFACDGYRYAGKPVDTRERIAQVCAALPDLKRLVIVEFLDERPQLAGLRGAVRFVQYEAPGELAFAQLPFDHPLYILYSSGTTGAPKCIVHGAGGTLIQHLKELMLHTDVQPGDRLFFYTTCGWMMWNWLVSGLA
ncbi:MAG: AMP-binding protein, partial [Nevskiaceae bacterium]